MRRLRKVVLAVSVYTMASATVNQYTTLLGYVNGGYELDPTARYLFLKVGPVVETIVALSIPILLILVVYLNAMEWTSSEPRKAKLQRLKLNIGLYLLVLLAMSTTLAAISDFIALHAHHLV